MADPRIAAVPAFLPIETYASCGRFRGGAAQARCAAKAIEDEAVVFEGMAARGEQILAASSARGATLEAPPAAKVGVSLRAARATAKGREAQAPAATGGDELDLELQRGKVEAAYQSWLAEQGGK